MRRSYFAPLLFLAGILISFGLLGVYAASIVAQRERQLTIQSVESADEVAPDDRVQFIRSLRDDIGALRRKHAWLEALSVVFMGLIFAFWAFDRWAMRDQHEPTELGARRAKGRLADLRNLAFGVLLVMMAIAALIYLRLLVPDWVDTAHWKSDEVKADRIRQTLARHGIVAKEVWYHTHGKRWDGIVLEGPDVNDISGVAETPVSYLCIRNTRVTDLSPLKRSQITRLDLEGSLVSDLSPLAGTLIDSLDLRGTNVSDLRPLAQMPRLQSVMLTRKQILDNLRVLQALRITVQEMPGGPGFNTQGTAWQKQYEAADTQRP
jgi:hypothetical protein